MFSMGKIVGQIQTHPPPPKGGGMCRLQRLKILPSVKLGKYVDIFLFYFAGHEPIIIL
jgi:hypothetical protein